MTYNVGNGFFAVHSIAPFMACGLVIAVVTLLEHKQDHVTSTLTPALYIRGCLPAMEWYTCMRKILCE